jgi:IS30 family transposase
MWKNDWLASLSLRTVLLFPVRPCAGKAVDMAPGRRGGGHTHGARSRSPVVCRSTFRKMRPCASAMKPSIQTLFVHARGALRRELAACLRTGRVFRMPRVGTHKRGKAFISSEIMIGQRPAEAADRTMPDDWEGDLILGLGSSAIGTLVERTTRTILTLPEQLRRSLMWDQRG